MFLLLETFWFFSLIVLIQFQHYIKMIIRAHKMLLAYNTIYNKFQLLVLLNIFKYLCLSIVNCIILLSVSLILHYGMKFVCIERQYKLFMI